MKIAIDARMMGAGNTRGIGRYIEELIRALLTVPSENQYTLIVRSPDHPFQSSAGVKTIIADIPWYGWKEQISFAKQLLAIDADLLHVPHWNVPLAYRKPFVVTIHDLLLRHQAMSAKASTQALPIRLLKRLGYRLALDHAMKQSKAICVPTTFVKQDIEQCYPGTASKIHVTGEGITDLPAPSSSRAPYPFFFYVGSAYPHKRLDLLLQTWSSLQKTYPQHHLILAGEMDVFMKRLQDQSKQQELSRIHFEGRITDQRLADLYHQAQSFIFPSEFEGFGLPPLEALVHGCPVICAENPPMTEVLGRQGVIYFKSGSVDDMIRAVKTVVDNLESMQSQAKKAGEDVRVRHTWKQAAEQTLKVYRAVERENRI